MAIIKLEHSKSKTHFNTKLLTQNSWAFMSISFHHNSKYWKYKSRYKLPNPNSPNSPPNTISSGANWLIRHYIAKSSLHA